MDTKLLLDCYKLYADKLEQLCKQHMPKATAKIAISDLWIESVMEILDEKGDSDDISDN